MMSKKHYIAIATAIRESHEVWEKWSNENNGENDGVTAIVDVTTAIARVFALDNPRFDTHRFLEAALGE